MNFQKVLIKHGIQATQMGRGDGRSPSRWSTVMFQPLQSGRLRSIWGPGPGHLCQRSTNCHRQEGRRGRL